MLTVPPGNADEPNALLDGMIPNRRAEPGNPHWNVRHDSAQPDRTVLELDSGETG